MDTQKYVVKPYADLVLTIPTWLCCLLVFLILAIILCLVFYADDKDMQRMNRIGPIFFIAFKLWFIFLYLCNKLQGLVWPVYFSVLIILFIVGLLTYCLYFLLKKIGVKFPVIYFIIVMLLLLGIYQMDLIISCLENEVSKYLTKNTENLIKHQTYPYLNVDKITRRVSPFLHAQGLIKEHPYFILITYFWAGMFQLGFLKDIFPYYWICKRIYCNPEECTLVHTGKYKYHLVEWCMNCFNFNTLIGLYQKKYSIYTAWLSNNPMIDGNFAFVVLACLMLLYWMWWHLTNKNTTAIYALYPILNLMLSRITGKQIIDLYVFINKYLVYLQFKPHTLLWALWGCIEVILKFIWSNLYYIFLLFPSLLKIFFFINSEPLITFIKYSYMGYYNYSISYRIDSYPVYSLIGDSLQITVPALYWTLLFVSLINLLLIIDERYNKNIINSLSQNQKNIINILCKSIVCSIFAFFFSYHFICLVEPFDLVDLTNSKRTIVQGIRYPLVLLPTLLLLYIAIVIYVWQIKDFLNWKSS